MDERWIDHVDFWGFPGIEGMTDAFGFREDVLSGNYDGAARRLKGLDPLPLFTVLEGLLPMRDAWEFFMALHVHVFKDPSCPGYQQTLGRLVEAGYHLQSEKRVERIMERVDRDGDDFGMVIYRKAEALDQDGISSWTTNVNRAVLFANGADVERRIQTGRINIANIIDCPTKGIKQEVLVRNRDVEVQGSWSLSEFLMTEARLTLYAAVSS